MVYTINVYTINEFPVGNFFGPAATLRQYIPFRVYRSQGTLREGDFRYTTILAGCCRLSHRATSAQARCHRPGWSQRNAREQQKKTYGDDLPLYYHRNSACRQANVSVPHSGKKKSGRGSPNMLTNSLFCHLAAAREHQCSRKSTTPGHVP